MSENKPLTLAEKVRLAKERMAQGAEAEPGPAPTSNMYSEDDTKLVSDQTAERLKNAGALAALAGKAVLDKSREATQLAKDKARELAEKRAADAQARAEQLAQAEREWEAAAAALAAEQVAPAPVAMEPEPAPGTTASEEVVPEPVEILADDEPVHADPEPFDTNLFEGAFVAEPAVQAPVKPIPAPVAPIDPGPVLVDAMPSKSSDPTAPSSRKRWILIGALAAVVVAGGVGAYLLQGKDDAPAPTPVSAPAQVNKPAPAVAPAQVAPPATIAPLTGPDMSAPVPVVETEPAMAYGMDEPKPEPAAPIETAPAPVVQAPKPKPVAPAPKPVEPVVKKKQVQAPTPRKEPVAPTQEKKDWQNDASEDLDALERQLGG